MEIRDGGYKNKTCQKKEEQKTNRSTKSNDKKGKKKKKLCREGRK